ncbi:MAG: ThuA domain-containing protein [Bacteroidia bacterium]|nr:ThuA domain-containing protein [Bacteroidia bacterium]
MKKFLLFFVGLLAVLILLLVIAGSIFVYKVKNGFPVSYETTAPAIDFPSDRLRVLLFSKSTGFRHTASIEAGKKILGELSEKNQWFIYNTEEGGVFNPEQLSEFDVVIFNNSTGRVLNDEQQKALENYVEQGGSLIGIHGAGDNSHHWDWYVQNLLGSEFSHHTLNPQFQETQVMLHSVADSLMTVGLPSTWTHTDEWYVFFENPETKGFNILYTIDGEKINPSGNMLWMKDKNFGMGKSHPIAWYKAVGQGHTFYTSMGHDAQTWEQEPFVQMLENAVMGRNR